MKNTYIGIVSLLLTVICVAPANAADLQVSAIIPSQHSCKFSTPGPLALDFGTLDPFSGSDVVRSTTVDFECNGNKNTTVVYSITDDDGLHETGANASRMKHTALAGADAYIPYDLDISPTGGSTPTKTPVTLTVTGTVLGTSYRMAYEGAYADTVTISLDP